MQDEPLDPRHNDDGDRRKGRRYPALDNTSEVAWSKDGRLTTTAAQLMDVSGDGLLVLVDESPPVGALVMIRLVQPTVTTWVEAHVMQTRPMRQGPHEVRLSFNGPPPPAFLTLAASRRGDVN